MQLVRTPPAFEGEPQALGEQYAQSAQDPKTKASTPAPPVAPPTPIGKTEKTRFGVIYETLKEGTGPVVHNEQTITMHYTGTLTDGTVFESSRTRNQPVEVKIGVGQAIRGWDMGIPGMRVGERRKLTIPPEIGYGPGGKPGKVPSNATVIYDVEVLKAE
jgi:FKBP-type peptidyl-prolyl cis-trans isomerase